MDGEAGVAQIVRLYGDRDFAQRQFEMILHAPDDDVTATHFGGLHLSHHVARQWRRTRRQFANLVSMDCRRVPSRRRPASSEGARPSAAAVMRWAIPTFIRSCTSCTRPRQRSRSATLRTIRMAARCPRTAVPSIRVAAALSTDLYKRFISDPVRHTTSNCAIHSGDGTTPSSSAKGAITWFSYRAASVPSARHSFRPNSCPRAGGVGGFATVHFDQQTKGACVFRLSTAVTDARQSRSHTSDDKSLSA